MRPLTSLHQALILSLSTPGSNFTSKPCIPSSPLSFSPGFPFSLFHQHFLFLSVTTSLFYIPYSLFFLPFFYLAGSPPLPLTPHLHKLLPFCVCGCCNGVLVGSGSEQKGNNYWNTKTEGVKRVAACIHKVKDRCGSDFKPLISTMHSFRLPKANTRSSRLWLF